MRPASAPAAFTTRRARIAARGGLDAIGAILGRQRRHRAMGDDRRAMAPGGGGEGGSHFQRIGLALRRAIGAADHALGEIGRAAVQLRLVEQLHLQPLGALDLRLALDVAQLRLALAHQKTAAEGEFQIAAELGLQPLPEPDGGQHQRDGGGENARPILALEHEGLMGDLGVDAAGIAARGLGVEIAALEQRDLDALAGQEIGRRRAGQPAADDQNIGLCDVFAHGAACVPSIH